jgi:archaeosine-15-forming tRNA-guanine transglycosylase
MPEMDLNQESSMNRVAIKDGAVPFVARGGRVFSRQVLTASPGIEDGDTVQIVDKNGHLLNIAYVYITA